MEVGGRMQDVFRISIFRFSRGVPHPGGGYCQHLHGRSGVQDSDDSDDSDFDDLRCGSVGRAKDWSCLGQFHFWRHPTKWKAADHEVMTSWWLAALKF